MLQYVQLAEQAVHLREKSCKSLTREAPPALMVRVHLGVLRLMAYRLKIRNATFHAAHLVGNSGNTGQTIVLSLYEERLSGRPKRLSVAE